MDNGEIDLLFENEKFIIVADNPLEGKGRAAGAGLRIMSSHFVDDSQVVRGDKQHHLI